MRWTSTWRRASTSNHWRDVWKRPAEKATLLRRKAKDAGNASAELKTADDLIDARWTGTEDGSAEDGSPENADPGTVNPEREHPAMEENTQGGMPGEPNRWEGGES